MSDVSLGQRQHKSKSNMQQRNMIQIRQYQRVLDVLKRRGQTRTRHYRIIQQRLQRLKGGNNKQTKGKQTAQSRQRNMARQQSSRRNVNRNVGRRNMRRIRQYQRVLDILKRRGQTNTRHYRIIQQRLQRLKGDQQRGRRGLFFLVMYPA